LVFRSDRFIKNRDEVGTDLSITDANNLLGLDVGFSATRPTTGIARLVYGLKQTENGAMNSAGDMSSKTGSIEIKTYEKSLNWFMRVKLICRFSFRSESSSSIHYDYGRSGDG
jgi:hypothetical protein